MNEFFNKIRVGCLNDHFDILGGGTVHSFKFLEYLKKYYDIDVYLPKTPKTKEWMKKFLHLDVDGLTFHKYTKGIGEKYNYLFLNISHWKAEETKAFKKYMLVFFPQFYFPLYDYEFLANSKYTKKNIIKRWGRQKEKVHVVYPPIMTSQFKPAKKKENMIVHVSRFSNPKPEVDKGHSQMIEAFRAMCDAGLKNWTFHLVGQVQDPDYLMRLKQEAADYPVIFDEGISFKKLQELYAKAKIYWHYTGSTMKSEPGAQEHFGMTTVEAMSSGCIPVVYASGGQLEIITDGQDGFLVKSIASLISETSKLIKSPKALKDMSESAIKRSKCFDESETEKKFWSVISKTDKVSIIIICWNNAKYTKECVDRLYEVTPPGFELILIDNNSPDNTKQVFKEIKKKYKKHDIKLIFNKSNLGFAKGNNVGLKKAKRPYICYLNNDTLPQWGWLERMIDVLETKKKAGVVGAKLYFPKHDVKGWLVQHAGIEFKNKEPKHIGGRQKDENVRKVGIEEVGAVTGACMLVRKRFAKFNEDFIKGYYEDIDLCLKVRAKGYKVYINHEAKLIHYEGKGQSIARAIDKKKFGDIARRNKALFHKLWDKKMKKLPKVSLKLDLAATSKDQKVEIGGGENPLYPKFVQVDLRKLPGVKYQNDARLLPFPSNSLSIICACYVLQCLSQTEAERALKEWFRCLRPGGKLEIYVPDLDKIIRIYLSTTEEKFLKEIYGNQEHELDFYQTGWTFQTLEKLVSKVNFVRLNMIDKPKHRPFALSIAVYKPK